MNSVLIAMHFTAKTARKGQSAIEYLTTYGWALLAIIIVGAVLVNMGIFNQCQTNTPRYSGQSVALADWGWQGTNSMSVTFQAINNDVTVQNISFDWDQDGTFEDGQSSAMGLSVTAGDTATQSISGLATTSGECATGAVRIEFDRGDATGLIATGSGTLRGPVP